MKPKTPAQRSAVHLWIRHVAEQLNDAGLEKRVVIERLGERGIDMPWTQESFKADVYKPIFQSVFAKQSTEEASTTDHDKIYHGLIRWFALEFEIELPPFPSKDTA